VNSGMTEPPDAAHPTSFNLLDEPWLPVVIDNAAGGDVPLTTLFRIASRIDRLGAEVGTMNVALLRLLLAILHRALAAVTPDSADESRTIVEELRNRWDEAGLPVVLDYLERHRERFFLFHPTMPFYQVADLASPKGEVSELSRLVAERPPYLGTRSTRGLRRISAADAARWLTHVHAYDVSGIKTGVVGHPRAKGGKVYPEGVGWCGQLGSLHLVGRTLLDTLLLNLWAAVSPAEVRDHDLPPWERPPTTADESPELASRPYGPVDLYTWQPRLVRLVGDENGVTGVVLTYGDRFIVQKRQWVQHIEPMTGWRYSKPQSAKYHEAIFMPRTHDPNSQLWRSMSTLIRPGAERAPTDDLPAQVIEHASQLRGSSLLPDGIVRLHATGVTYGSNNSVLDDFFDDGLDLPGALLDPEQRALRAVAINAVSAARNGTSAVWKLADNLARAAGASGDSVNGARQEAEALAYSRLDPLYRDWILTDLTLWEHDLLVSEAHWHSRASTELYRLGEDLVHQVPLIAWRGFDANGPRSDVGQIFVWFQRGLDAAFPKQRAQQTAPDPQYQPSEVSR